MPESSNSPAEPTSRKHLLRIALRIFVIAGGLGVMAILSIVLAVFVQYRRNDRPIAFPIPRGPHPVGRMLLDCRDARRDREIMVFLWYPAQPGTDGNRCEYIPGLWGEIEAEKMLPIPARRYREIEVAAIENAPLAAGSLPVLVLLPGMGASRRITPRWLRIWRALAIWSSA
jgi:hypothetical protein